MKAVCGCRDQHVTNVRGKVHLEEACVGRGETLSVPDALDQHALRPAWTTHDGSIGCDMKREVFQESLVDF